MTRHRITHRHRADEPRRTPPGALTQMCHRCDALFYAPRILDHCPACAAAVVDEMNRKDAHG